MNRVLFYTDSQGFGGHEIMAVTIMRELCRLKIEIHLLCLSSNRQMLEAAGKIGHLEITSFSLAPQRAPLITNLLLTRNRDMVRCLIREARPACIVAIQGTIGISSLVLMAAKKERVPVITYIAFCQKMRDLGIPYASGRDLIAKAYYRMPDKFIVISDMQRSLMINNGVPEQKVVVVPNVIPFSDQKRYDKETARTVLRLDRSKTYVGLLGRVVIAHKGHDYLVRAVSSRKDDFAGMQFLIVGSGPDLEQVKQIVAVLGVEERFTFHPWTEEMSVFYSALDAVVMPSNHEGVPLVMIEAVLCGLPVIASSIDGMKEYLPDAWLFERGNVAQLAERIMSVTGSNQSVQCHDARTRFEKVFLRQTIGDEVAKVIDEVVCNCSVVAP